MSVFSPAGSPSVPRFLLMSLLMAAALPRLAAAEGLFAEPESGLDFVHFNGMTGAYYFPEMMGSGAAFFDYDGDGDMDAYVVQGHMLNPADALEDALIPPAHDKLVDRLYRNDTEPGGGAVFTDVTAASGIVAAGYGMGVAAGDYDNDGHVDLYVANYGSNQLWRNLGNGRFEEVTSSAGVDDLRWSVSSAWVDYDHDGDLDLYVGNYVKHSLENRRTCRLSKRELDYCGPLASAGDTDSLFRNDGNGRFTDVSKASGIEAAWGGALGVIAADFDSDGWVDIYVANDGVANQLWMNQRDGTFKNEALIAGVAVNRDGMPEASMGVDAADFDGDGDEDLFMTHLRQETNTLYVNDGSGWFDDDTAVLGVGNPSFQYTGFGTAWFDYDNDGWLDILSVNGAVKKIDALVRAGDPYPLHQRNQLFRNLGEGRYKEVTDDAGPAFAVSLVSRGAAFGDIDDDGDVDVLITNNAGPARLLINVTGQDARWLGLRLMVPGGKRDAYGARAVLEVGDVEMWRRVRADGSYASSNDPRILFGLGDRETNAYRARVVWPDGTEEAFPGLAPGRYHRLEQGGGEEINQ